MIRGDHACGCVSSDNCALLMNVTSYLVDDFGGTHLNEDILNETVMTVFSCLTSLGTLLVSPTSEGMAFADLMAVLVNLAEEESGLGHVQLFKACLEWLYNGKTYLMQKNVIEKLEQGITTSGCHSVMLENMCYVLNYLNNVVQAIRLGTNLESKDSSTDPTCCNELTELGGRSGH